MCGWGRGGGRLVAERAVAPCYLLPDVETRPWADQGWDRACSRPQSRAVGQDATACNPVGCGSLGDQTGLSPGGKLPAWWTGRWGPLCWCPRDNKDFRKDSPDSGLKEALVSCLAA